MKASQELSSTLLIHKRRLPRKSLALAMHRRRKDNLKLRGGLQNLIKALCNLVWRWCWPCFKQVVELDHFPVQEILSIPFHLQLVGRAADFTWGKFLKLTVITMGLWITVHCTTKWGNLQESHTLSSFQLSHPGCSCASVQAPCSLPPCTATSLCSPRTHD